MKRTLTALFAILFCMMAARPSAGQAVAPNTKTRPDRTLFLYEEKVPHMQDPVQGKSLEALGLNAAHENGLDVEERYEDNGNIWGIGNEARMDLYFPKKANGKMIVVCPGGGYRFVSAYNEGVFVADWMLRRGYTVAVLKYRLPNGHWEVPLEDVHNTFRYCRQHAGEWGVDQIGIIGFSAGGHLACTASNLFVDEVTRPDFSILFYPVITMGADTHKGSKWQLIGKEDCMEAGSYADLVRKYSGEEAVTTETPQTFIVHCQDDPVVPVQNSLGYYKALLTHKVTAEMHILPVGKHGWGFSSERYVEMDRLGYARQNLEDCLERWLDGLE